MNAQQLAELVGYGSEQTSVEFKLGLPLTDKQFLAKVIRAILGMANTRDGGVVLIGVSEGEHPPRITGVDGSALKTWGPDAVAAQVARFASPAVQLRVEHISVEGRNVVAIGVSEFSEEPILCAADWMDTLRRGAVYVRPRGKPATTEVSSLEDMRNLLGLATEKRLRAFVTLARKADLEVSQSASSRQTDLFEKQLLDVGLQESGALLDRPSVTFVVRPGRFEADRIVYTELEDRLLAMQVKLAGRTFPHAPSNLRLERGLDWIGMTIMRPPYEERWRFCQSGQFVHTERYMEDSSGQPPAGMGEHERVGDRFWLGIGRTIIRFMSCFEFAARMALGTAAADSIYVRARFTDTKRRVLAVDNVLVDGLDRDHEYTFDGEQYVHEQLLGVEDLIARAAELGAQEAAAMLARFGYRISPDAALRMVMP